jgi:hypothetical protein
VNLNDPTYKLNAYPNPFQKYLIVEGTSTQLQQLRLYNTIGRDFSEYLNKGKCGDGLCQFNLEALPAGQYILKTHENVTLLIKR